MSLLFNMLSRLVTAFLPRSKHVLISWLQSPSAVILEPKKIRSVTVSHVSPSICHQVMGPDAVSWSCHEVTQSCLTLCDPMDSSPPGSSIHGIFQATVLDWVAISFSRGSSRPKDQTQVSHIAGRCFTVWATKEAQIFLYLFGCIRSYMQHVGSSSLIRDWTQAPCLGSSDS